MAHRTFGVLALPLVAAVIAGCSDNGNSPTPPTYTVGGTVTGLTAGKSLVLRNNGADDKAIAADGAFTFATALRDGAAYAVTVSTQPSGMACPVSNGTGTIAATDVTSVVVSCAAITTALDPTFGLSMPAAAALILATRWPSTPAAASWWRVIHSIPLPVPSRWRSGE
jgi:hypothetical protein